MKNTFCGRMRRRLGGRPAPGGAEPTNGARRTQGESFTCIFFKEAIIPILEVSVKIPLGNPKET